MTGIDWFLIVVFLGSLVWGIDRHLCLRDVEISMKDYLGDLLVSRDSARDKLCECCAQSRVLEFKTLIRKHFNL